MARPQWGVAFDFNVSLIDTAARPALKSDPTLAAGDVKVSKDNGAFANLATLPSVAPAASPVVRVSLSATEMQADRVSVWFKDAAGVEWDELVIHVNTEADIDVDGAVDDGSPAVGSFTGDSGLSATDDFYNGAVLVFTSGALKSACRKVSDYVGSTKEFLFTGATGSADEPFPAAPASGDRFKILGRIGS